MFGINFDNAFAFTKVISSALGAISKHVLLNLRGLADGDTEIAELSPEEPTYGALGVVSRPRDADADGAAEVIAARGDDSLTPVAARDLRISKARGTVNKGTVSLAGYGGAFVSIDDAPQGTGSIVTVYAPYEHDGDGVPSKAHAITVDTTTGNEHVAVIHAAGHAILLTDDGKVIVKNADGSVFVTVESDGVVVAGDMKFSNNVIVGSGATADKVMLATPTIAFVQAAATVLTKLAVAVNLLPGMAGTISPTEIANLGTAAGVFNLTPYLTRSRLLRAESDVP